MILQAYPYLHFDDIRQALSHADGDLEVDYARMREAPGRCRLNGSLTLDWRHEPDRGCGP